MIYNFRFTCMVVLGDGHMIYVSSFYYVVLDICAKPQREKEKEPKPPSPLLGCDRQITYGSLSLLRHYLMARRFGRIYIYGIKGVHRRLILFLY